MSAKPTPDQQKTICGLEQMTTLVKQPGSRLENTRKDQGDLESFGYITGRRVCGHRGVRNQAEHIPVIPETYALDKSVREKALKE